MSVLFDNDRFPKGKYQGKTVSEVCKLNKHYIKSYNTHAANGNTCISDEVIKSLSYVR